MKLLLKTNILFLLLSFGALGQPLQELQDPRALDSLLSFTEETAHLRPKEALSSARKIQQQALQENDSILYADALGIEATAHFRMHNFDEASRDLHQAISVFQDLGDTLGVIRLSTTLAEIEAFTGSYFQALTRLEKALALTRYVKNPASKLKILYTLAQVRLLQEEGTAALELAHQALDLAKEINARRQRGQIYILLAKIKLQSDDFRKAQSYLDHAMLISEGLGAGEEMAEIHAVRAKIAYQSDHLQKALAEIKKALDLAQEFGFPYQYIRHLLIYSQLLAESGKAEQSLNIAQRADSLASMGKNLAFLTRDIARQLSQSYLLAGDSARALEQLLLFNSINDSIRDFDFEKMLLMRNLDAQQQKLNNLSIESENKEELISRSRLFLILGAGLCVVFVLLIVVLLNNVWRKRKYTRSLIRQKITIEEKQKKVEQQQVQLEEKNKKLEEMDKTKNKIFSVLTHDLRQPITQVKSVLNLLETEGMSEEDRVMMVSKLKESVDNSSNALENLLLWSKKQLTGLNTRIVDVHLLPQVWQLESQVKPNLETKNLKLEISIPDFFKIKADMNQLDICLRNLVNNAIKFSNPGGTIKIETTETPEYKIIHVRDNGVGMDAEHLNKLQQLSESVTTLGTMNEKGTGLGILIVHEFMQNQNGKLEIRSEKGQGSVFSLYFPVVNKDDSRTKDMSNESKLSEKTL